MKTILGLDLGTNSIGWALIKQDEKKNEGEIIKLGSRIIPMSEDILGKFDSGITESDTAKRTSFRGIRRLRERNLLRRERLHRVLNILDFLPEHYANEIDFEQRFGKYKKETEPKIAYSFNEDVKRFEFSFKNSFNEMVEDFKIHQPQLLEGGKKIPYDWTIYYLRNKSLTQKIEKEELAWLLLNFNQKRGYYQLRGEEEDETPNKLVEFHSLSVTDVIDSGDKKGKDEVWYNVVLENGWIYRRTSKTPLDWTGKRKDFIVTTDLNEDGTIKKDKDGKEKRTFRAPSEGDWTLLKKQTEFEIDRSGKTVGTFIYDTLLQNPTQKINGELVRVIERKFYKEELKQILQTQQKHHPELRDKRLYEECITELYENNDAHRSSISSKDFVHLFLEDIIFYQRPLKSKKSLISDCKYESRIYLKACEKITEPIKCIAKSHPLFQEFRLWQWMQNLRIYEKANDKEVTNQFLNTEEDWVNLFEWLNDRKEVDHKALLSYLLKPSKLKVSNYRWNYVYDAVKDESKYYPCNETRSMILSRLAKVQNVPTNFLTKEKEEALWHILYSVNDKIDVVKALNSFATKNGLAEDFVEQFKKFPPFKSDYGAYSAKAIKKLLPLMRMGKYWNEEAIHSQTKERISKIMSGEYDETIKDRVRDKAINLTQMEHFRGLPLWLTSYIAYDRHSEGGDIQKWKTAKELAAYLKEFKQHSLRNPIVEQVITETLRVVKDIWNTYGEGKENFFDEIHIELGREMKNPADKRKEMTLKITDNENSNLRIKALLAELQNDSQIENVRPYSPSQQELLRIYEDGVLNSGLEIDDDILKISRSAQPSKSDLIRYKLWLDQKYRSPYTGKIIPLNKLFTPAYEIEHIIPQSRFFDDSFSNKVICESEVNKLKDNMLALEFIKSKYGTTVILSHARTVQILLVEDYEKRVKEDFAKSHGKMKKLLLEDIPEKMVERQMNDTRYITKVVKNLLSNIVREEKNDEGTTSNNVLSGNGQITSALKQDWGLNDVWNEIIAPRFERLNKLTNSKDFGNVNERTNKFLPTVPLILSKGFTKKRIDHRHHAMDALVIACATRSHINYLNNQNALEKGKSKEQKQQKREDLRSILCHKKYNEGSNSNYKWVFNKPWDKFTQDTRNELQTTVVSFKQNLRVINKTVNKYEKWETKDGIKEKVIATQKNKGESWAIRKPIHKDTVSGLVRLRFKKTVMLSVALENWEDIVDNELRKYIKELVGVKYDKKMLQKHFKDRKNVWKEKDVSRVEIFYWDKENVASRVKLDESFNATKIESITDTGIQNILKNHLQSDKYQNAKDANGKLIAPETLAFSADGIDEMNKNTTALNGGKQHQPIYKVRTYEPKGNKFSIGQTGNKKDKYVEAAKGTNLFFAIYKDEKGKRNYATVPFNEVMESQKQSVGTDKIVSVPERNENGDSLLFHLSPNDLVFVPTDAEILNKSLVDFNNLSREQVNRVYKMVSSTEGECHFVQNNYSKEIIKNENGSNNKSERLKEYFNSLDILDEKGKLRMIKEVCFKLKVDRLGNVKPIK